MTKKIRMKKIPHYENYYITDDGRVYNSKHDRFLNGQIAQHNSVQVGLVKYGKTKEFTVARLVANAFLPKPKKCENIVVHLDGNSQNNNVSNLAWREKTLLTPLRKYLMKLLGKESVGKIMVNLDGERVFRIKIGKQGFTITDKSVVYTKNLTFEFNNLKQVKSYFSVKHKVMKYEGEL